ncbi:MAG: hypothetical protein ABI130_05480 [Leifsonia sp.]
MTGKHSLSEGAHENEDPDLTEETEVAPEESIPGLPEPVPTDGEAPAP